MLCLYGTIQVLDLMWQSGDRGCYLLRCCSGVVIL